MFQNRLGWPYSWKEIYRVFFCFTLYLRAIFQVQAPRGGGLYLEGRLNGGFFVLLAWGAYIWGGLYMEGLIFGILRYFFPDGIG